MTDIYSLPAQRGIIPERHRTVALGLFDGVHPGHRAVISTAVRIGNGGCAVYTFMPQTMDTKPDNKRLCTADEQHSLMRQIGVTELFEVDFSTVRDMSPAEFVERVLVRQLDATAVTCGYNYRFGKSGAGDAALLEQLGAARGIAVTVIPPVSVQGRPVSSSSIRRAIAEGHMAEARMLLGRGFCLHLPVIHGQHLGRTLGIPTVNQALPADMVWPRFGVYAALTEVNGQVYPAVTNIGIRPTVGADAPLAETWILGFTGDLYGQTVAVYPIRYLRPEVKFDNLDQLKTRIRADADEATALFTPSRDGYSIDLLSEMLYSIHTD